MFKKWILKFLNIHFFAILKAEREQTYAEAVKLSTLAVKCDIQKYCAQLDAHRELEKKVSDDWRKERSAKHEEHERYMEGHAKQVEQYLSGFNALLQEFMKKPEIKRKK